MRILQNLAASPSFELPRIFAEQAQWRAVLILFGEGMPAFWPRGDSVLAGKVALGGLTEDGQTTSLQRGEDGGRTLSSEAMKA